jgi:DNA-binding beta-propeller fold protein YncE
VADTYNNKIKTIDPATGSTETLVGSGTPGRTDDPPTFDQPGGITAAAGKLYVADTNNHLIRVIDLRCGNKVATLSTSRW